MAILGLLLNKSLSEFDFWDKEGKREE